MSEHEVNTDRLITKNSSMRHVEGGWPRDVDFTEQSDVSRFRKKAEKDDEYKGAVKLLGPIIARCMKQNNTIDIYEVSSPTPCSLLITLRTISTLTK
jgi:dynein intermediate chain 2, axonemal